MSKKAITTMTKVISAIPGFVFIAKVTFPADLMTGRSSGLNRTVRRAHLPIPCQTLSSLTFPTTNWIRLRQSF